MNVLIVEGCDSLGLKTALLLEERNINVRLLSPCCYEIPGGKTEIITGGFIEKSDDELLKLFDGCDVFVFTAAAESFTALTFPVYEIFKEKYTDPLCRMLNIAKAKNVSNNVIVGSYLSYFAKIYPDMRLAKRSSFVRALLEQEKAALGFADGKSGVAVLEMPYIAGISAATGYGGKSFDELFSVHFSAGPYTFFPTGGTAAVTVRQAAQAIAGAVENNNGKSVFPIGYFNLGWNDILNISDGGSRVSGRKTKHIPKPLFDVMLRNVLKKTCAGKDISGINAENAADLMSMDLFVDKKAAVSLGVSDDDIEAVV